MEKNERTCSCGEDHDFEKTNKLTAYVWEGLRLYAIDNPVDRHTMANVFFQVCSFFFIIHSPQNINGQIEEIENFCNALKQTALENAPSMQ